MTDDLPSAITANPEILNQALAAVNSDLAPAPARVMAVAVGRFLDFANTFQIGGKWDAQTVAAEYAEDLADMPGSLLMLAFKRLRQNWHWRSLPLPGDVRGAVALEMGELARVRVEFERVALKMRLAAKSKLSKASLAPIKPLTDRPMPVFRPQKMEAEPVDLTPEEWAKKLAEYEAIK